MFLDWKSKKFDEFFATELACRGLLAPDTKHLLYQNESVISVHEVGCLLSGTNYVFRSFWVSDITNRETENNVTVTCSLHGDHSDLFQFFGREVFRFALRDNLLKECHWSL